MASAPFLHTVRHAVLPPLRSGRRIAFPDGGTPPPAPEFCAFVAGKLLAGHLGLSFEALEAFLEPPGALLAASWSLLGRSWGGLGASWVPLGSSWRRLKNHPNNTLKNIDFWTRFWGAP